MSRVYRAAYHYIRDGVSAVLAEIVDAPESAPQTVGAAMVITANETFGTIGGGVMEAQVIELARSRVLAEKTDLTETVNTHGCADCRVQMIFYDGEKPAVKKHLLELARAEKHALIPMYICGAGHVAREVASLASKMGFRVTVVDDREDMLTPERFPDCDLKVVKDYSNPPECDHKSFILIMTRGHEYDAKALVWALRQDYFYLGMMGSKAKRDQLFLAASANGISMTKIYAQCHCPIGLNIGGGSPAEIAVSIMAEVQMERYGTTFRKLKKK